MEFETSHAPVVKLHVLQVKNFGLAGQGVDVVTSPTEQIPAADAAPLLPGCTVQLRLMSIAAVTAAPIGTNV